MAFQERRQEAENDLFAIIFKLLKDSERLVSEADMQQCQ